MKLVLLTLSAALSAAPFLLPSAPADAFAGVDPHAFLDAPQDELKVGRLMKTCEKCHEDVYEEWNASAHAKSWSSPTFQAAIAGLEDKGESCAACHAPGSLTDREPGALPVSRSNDRELGVNCVTCHVDSKKEYYGPVPSKGHGDVNVKEAYRDAQWCSSCHGHAEVNEAHDQYTSYLAGPAAEKGTACQECHMRPVTRQLAKSKRPLRGLQPAVETRMHDFAALVKDGEVEGAAQLSVVLDGSAVKVSITPHDGHSMPAGEGRVIELVVEFRGDGGTALGSETKAWSQESGDVLAPGVKVDLEFAAPDGATSAALRLESVRPVVPGRTAEERSLLVTAAS